MIYRDRRIPYPSSVYRPAALAMLTEHSDILDLRGVVVNNANWSQLDKLDKTSIGEPAKGFLGSYEVDGAVVVELLDDGTVYKHHYKLAEFQVFGGLKDKLHGGVMRGSFLDLDNFLLFGVQAIKPMKILGVYLKLKNGVHAWANAIADSSNLKLVKYRNGEISERTYNRIRTQDIRLGVKAVFVDAFEKIENIMSDELLTSAQKVKNKKQVLEQISGDVIYLDEEQWVTYTFGVLINGNRSKQCIWDIRDLIDNSTGNLLTTDYWFDDKEITLPQGGLAPIPFWQGRNTILQSMGIWQSIVSESAFKKKLFNLAKDCMHGKVFLNDSMGFNWEEGWSNIPVNYYVLAEIFLTAFLKTPVSIFASCSGVFNGDFLSMLAKYLGSCHTFVLEWVDFNNVDPNPNVRGFNADYLYDIDFLTFLNVEESAFNIGVMPGSICSAFRPFRWKFYNFPDASSCSVPRDYYPPEPGYYTEYELVEVVGVEDMSSHNAVEVLIHEIGHGVDAYGVNIYGQKFSEMPEWLNLCGWQAGASYENSLAKIDKDGYSNELPGGGECPVSGYGCVHQTEDFAEAYRMYIINPIFLKEVFPRRYNFMDKYVKNLRPVGGLSNCAIKNMCTKRSEWCCA